MGGYLVLKVIDEQDNGALLIQNTLANLPIISARITICSGKLQENLTVTAMISLEYLYSNISQSSSFINDKNFKLMTALSSLFFLLSFLTFLISLYKLSMS